MKVGVLVMKPLTVEYTRRLRFVDITFHILDSDVRHLRGHHRVIAVDGARVDNT
ncbi:MAG: hypothetical protein GPOALKHO_001852 [Sodalis sp.]|nr:MAG: hypothetical protein GPOALKHO_001852 [Sodalis sp.]